MPGFLGTEKQFTAKYGKPILQSRDAKSSSKEQEAGKFEKKDCMCENVRSLHNLAHYICF